MYQNTSRSRSLSNLMRSRSSSSVGGGLPGGRNYRMSVNRAYTPARTLARSASIVSERESAREQEHISRRQEMAVDQATRGGYKSSVEKTTYTPPASLSPYSSVDALTVDSDHGLTSYYARQLRTPYATAPIVAVENDPNTWHRGWYPSWYVKAWHTDRNKLKQHGAYRPRYALLEAIVNTPHA